LPGGHTPFECGPRHGLAKLHFQFGKYLCGSAPILVGWVVAVLAVRQRANAIWPSTGIVLVAWMGAAARIRASRTEGPRGLGLTAWNLSFGHGLKTGTTVLFMHWSFSRLRCCHISLGEFTSRERCPPDLHFHDWTNRPESLEP
jgi:hypothetical protein